MPHGLNVTVLKRCVGLWLLTGMILLGGCSEGVDGPPVVPVSGQVTFKGKGVADGQIHFADDQQGYIFPATIKQGSYSVTTQFGSGLPVGEYKVQVTPPPAPPLENPADPGDVAPTPAAPDIPEKYRSFETSGLTADVKDGSGPLNFELKEE